MQTTHLCRDFFFFFEIPCSLNSVLHIKTCFWLYIKSRYSDFLHCGSDVLQILKTAAPLPEHRAAGPAAPAEVWQNLHKGKQRSRKREWSSSAETKLPGGVKPAQGPSSPEPEEERKGCLLTATGQKGRSLSPALTFKALGKGNLQSRPPTSRGSAWAAPSAAAALRTGSAALNSTERCSHAAPNCSTHGVYERCVRDANMLFHWGKHWHRKLSFQCYQLTLKFSF